MRKWIDSRGRPLGSLDDSGSVLVLVLVVSVLLIASVGIAMAASQAGLSRTSGFKTSSQGEMAAQTGLATELTLMRTASSYTALPCSGTGSLTVPGAISSYSVTVTYAASTGPLPCPLPVSPLPTNATLTSVGKAPLGSQTEMKEDVAIAATPSLSAAFGDAIFTENDLNLTNAALLYTGTSVPDIYAGQQITCDNGTISQGDLVSYDPIDLQNACTFDGNVTSAGSVQLNNSATVEGNVTSYGGPLSLTGNALIGKNATETDGNISLQNSGKINGNADASGTITLSGSATIGGTQTPDDTSLSTETMPPPITFPTIDPSVTTWESEGWNVVQIGGTGQPTCATYFQSISSGSPDPFQNAIATETQKTVYYAPTCTPDYQNTHTFAFSADTVLQVATLTLQNSNIICEETASFGSGLCSSATSPGYDFSVLAGASSTCSTSSVDVSLSNSTNFEANMVVFIYSEGQVDYANAPSMTGQIFACGGMTGENAFTLTFNPAASAIITGGSGPPLTINPEDKYMVYG